MWPGCGQNSPHSLCILRRELAGGIVAIDLSWWTVRTLRVGTNKGHPVPSSVGLATTANPTANPTEIEEDLPTTITEQEEQQGKVMTLRGDRGVILGQEIILVVETMVGTMEKVGSETLPVAQTPRLLLLQLATVQWPQK